LRLGVFALKMTYHPIFHRFAQFVQMFVKKMSAVFKNYEFGFSVCRNFINQFLQVSDRAEFIAVAVNKEDRFAQIFKIIEIRIFIDRLSTVIG